MGDLEGDCKGDAASLLLLAAAAPAGPGLRVQEPVRWGEDGWWEQGGVRLREEACAGADGRRRCGAQVGEGCRCTGKPVRAGGCAGGDFSCRQAGTWNG